MSLVLRFCCSTADIIAKKHSFVKRKKQQQFVKKYLSINIGLVHIYGREGTKLWRNRQDFLTFT